MSEACKTGNCNVTPDMWGATSVTVGDLDLQDSSHPNVAPFNGTLLLLGQPSDQPPHGSDGHPIEVSKEVAESRLNTLPGMGINYQSDLTGHNPAKKVGVITEAKIKGDKVQVKGLIWKKDFPEAVRAFKANNGRLGMSMELGDVYVRDKDERVWHLEDFHFTGATVLLKNHAAYEGTSLAASRYFVKALAAAREARETFGKGGQPEMAKDEKKETVQSNGDKLLAGISASVEAGFAKAMTTFSEKLEASNAKFTSALESISASQEELVKGLHELAISTVEGSGDGEEEVEEVHAGGDDATMAMAKHEDDATEDSTDATDVEANVEKSFEEQGDGATPGDLNPEASGHAKSQARSGAGDRATKAGGKSVDKGIAAGRAVVKSMAAAKVIRNLQLEKNTLLKANEGLSRRLKSLEASMDRYADRVERKSLAPEVSALLEKNGYDVRDLMGTKQRLSVTDVDQILANAGVQLEPTIRASIKNQLLAAGMMEQGEVKRYN